jgi:hypothetical protein
VAFLFFFLPSFLPSFLLSFLPSFLPSFFPSSFPPSHLPPSPFPLFLLSFFLLPSFLPFFLPSFLLSFFPGTRDWIQGLMLGKCSTAWAMPPVWLYFCYCVLIGTVLFSSCSDYNLSLHKNLKQLSELWLLLPLLSIATRKWRFCGERLTKYHWLGWMFIEITSPHPHNERGIHQEKQKSLLLTHTHLLFRLLWHLNITNSQFS